MTQPLALPEPGYPLLVNLFTDNLVPPKDEAGASKAHAPKEEVVHWALTQAHPFIPGMTIMRMFVLTSTVEVYSRANDGTCMRDTIPMARVRLAQEGMPPQVFVEEITAAEGGGDDDDDDDLPDEPEPDEDHTPAPTANGQQTATS